MCVNGGAWGIVGGHGGTVRSGVGHIEGVKRSGVETGAQVMTQRISNGRGCRAIDWRGRPW